MTELKQRSKTLLAAAAILATAFGFGRGLRTGRTPIPSRPREMRKKVALSAVMGTVIMVAATAIAAPTALYVFQEQTDLFSTGSAIEVRNVSILRDGDTLTVTGTMKNVGQTSISGIFIDSISVSDIDIRQDVSTGIVTVSDDGFANEDAYCDLIGTTLPSNCDFDVERYDGFSILAGNSTNSEIEESILEGGRTNAFRLEITSASGANADISEGVNISDSMKLILRFNSGDDTLLTDPYTARVRSG